MTFVVTTWLGGSVSLASTYKMDKRITSEDVVRCVYKTIGTKSLPMWECGVSACAIAQWD